MHARCRLRPSCRCPCLSYRWPCTVSEANWVEPRERRRPKWKLILLSKVMACIPEINYSSKSMGAGQISGRSNAWSVRSDLKRYPAIPPSIFSASMAATLDPQSFTGNPLQRSLDVLQKFDGSASPDSAAEVSLIVVAGRSVCVRSTSSASPSGTAGGSTAVDQDLQALLLGITDPQLDLNSEHISFCWVEEGESRLAAWERMRLQHGMRACAWMSRHVVDTHVMSSVCQFAA